MKSRKITIEHGLYFTAFLIGITIRFLRLGQAPLSDSEAAWALQALNIAKGEPALIGSQPGYVNFMAADFFLFEATNFLARLAPAIFGSLLVLLPALFRGQIGKKASVFLAFALAVDPGLIAVSRQGDGFMLAVFGLLAGLGFALNNWPILAGVAIGFGFLNGAGFWSGLLPLALAAAWTFSRRRRSSDEDLEGVHKAENSSVFAGFDWRSFLIGLAAAFVLLGSLLFTVPKGLGAAFQGLPEFLRGWGNPSEVEVSRLWMAVLSAGLFPAIFGMWGLIRNIGSNDRIDHFLARWLLLAFLLTVIYPARQVVDLVWAFLPLWALAAKNIVDRKPLAKENRLAGFGLAVLAFVLLILIGLNLAGLSNFLQSGFEREVNIGQWMVPEQNLRQISIIGSLALIAVIAIIIAWGWSKQAAVFGLAVALGAGLLIPTVSAGWGAAGLGTHPETELWRRAPYLQEEDLLIQTIADFSERNVLSSNAVDISVVGVSSPALEWSLRDFDQVQFTNALSVETNPSIVITKDDRSPFLTASYTGQDFVWQQRPAWSLFLPEEWLRWMIFREAPVERKPLYLWVRGDLFPGSLENN